MATPGPAVSAWRGLAVRTCCVSYSTNVTLLLLKLRPCGSDSSHVECLTGSCHLVILMHWIFHWRVINVFIHSEKAIELYACAVSWCLTRSPVSTVTRLGDKANGTIMESTDAVILNAGPFWLSHILIRSLCCIASHSNHSVRPGIKGRLERSSQPRWWAGKRRCISTKAQTLPISAHPIAGEKEKHT